MVPVHVTPSPANPSLHAQVKLPAVFVHIAYSEQSLVPSLHSLISNRKNWSFSSYLHLVKLKSFISFTKKYTEVKTFWKLCKTTAYLHILVELGYLLIQNIFEHYQFLKIVKNSCGTCTCYTITSKSWLT